MRGTSASNLKAKSHNSFLQILHQPQHQCSPSCKVQMQGMCSKRGGWTKERENEKRDTNIKKKKAQRLVGGVPIPRYERRNGIQQTCNCVDTIQQVKKQWRAKRIHAPPPLLIPLVYTSVVTISTCAAHASARPHVREDNARARFVLFTTSLVREHEIFLTHSKQRQHYIARSNSQPRYIVCVCNRRNQGMHPISLPIHASARVVSYFVSVRQSMAFCSR